MSKLLGAIHTKAHAYLRTHMCPCPAKAKQGSTQNSPATHATQGVCRYTSRADKKYELNDDVHTTLARTQSLRNRRTGRGGGSGGIFVCAINGTRVGVN